MGVADSKGDSCSGQPPLSPRLPHTTTAHRGNKLPDRASICSRGIESGNVRMAVAFCLLSAKTDERHKGQRNGQGEIQTGNLQGILTIKKGVMGGGGACFDHKNKVQAQRSPLP